MIRYVLIVLLSCSVAWGQEKKEPIRVMSAVPVQSTSNSVVSLSSETVCVIESDVRCFIVASPGGSVGVVEEQGPLRYRAKFVDGKGIESRVFKGPFIYIVEAKSDGKDELVIVPEGVKSASEIKRVTFQVGTMPQPPPPGPQPQPVSGKLHGWVLIEETNKPFLNRGVILARGIEWSNQNGVKYRQADQDSAGPDLEMYVKRAKESGVPQLFLIKEDGEKLWQGPPPQGSDEFIELLKKYKGQ